MGYNAREICLNIGCLQWYQRTRLHNEALERQISFTSESNRNGQQRGLTIHRAWETKLFGSKDRKPAASRMQALRMTIVRI